MCVILISKGGVLVHLNKSINKENKKRESYEG